MVVDRDLHGNEVCLDSLDHVLVLPLLHQLKIGLLLDKLHLRSGLFDAVSLHVSLILDRKFLLLRLFKLTFDPFELAFFLLDLAANCVKLLAKLAHCHAHFFDLFAAALPRWDHVVWLQQRVHRHEGL